MYKKTRLMGKLIFPEINLNGVKGVLLDIDNTIYHYDSCHVYAFNIIINELFKILNLFKRHNSKEFLNSRKKLILIYLIMLLHTRDFYIFK